jgi:ABC-type transporter Mla subunit MlaD
MLPAQHLPGLRVRQRLVCEPEVLLDPANPALESLDALLKLIELEAEERPRLAELLIEVRAILGVAPLRVELRTLSEQLNVASQVFDEDASVTPEVSDLLVQAAGGLGELSDLLVQAAGGLGEVGDLLLEVLSDLGDLLADVLADLGELPLEVLPDLGEIPAESLGGRGNDPFDLRERLGVHRRLRERGAV